MILKKLVINNLRSYEEQEIIFPNGSTLLSGDIGSGKTTILLAVEFALFGLQPSQKANSLLRNGMDKGKVVLEFEIDGKQIVIERRLKRGKRSISQDYVSITIDDEKFEESVTEIKAKILGLLNYPAEFAKKTNLLYKFTVYTPQEEMKQIILESKDVRLNTLRHVFGIDKYKRIQENVGILTSRLREKIRINQALLQDLDKIKEDLVEKEKKLVELNKDEKVAGEEYKKSMETRSLREQAIKEIEDKINEKKGLENEKEKIILLVSEKRRQIDGFVSNINNLEQQIRDIEKLKFSEESYNSLDDRIKFQENKENEVQKEYVDIISKIKTFESKKMEAESLINKLSGLEKCPTCLQEVSQEYKNNMLENANKEIELVNKQITELDEKKKELIDSLEGAKRSRQEFEKQKSDMDLLKVKLEGLKEKEDVIKDIGKQRIGLEKDNEMLNQQVLTLEKSIKEYEKYDDIYEERVEGLKEARYNESVAGIKKAEIAKEIQFSEQQIKENKEKIEEKERLRAETEKIKELEFWISNKFLEIVLFTEKQVMITLKEEFSNLFSKWFSILVSESLTAKLDDDFSPVVEQQDYELDYSFLSGGERTAIALAYRLALNQVINSLLSNLKTSNIVILDEPTDGFSAEQLDKMRDVLDQLDTDQLILVSHEQRIEGFVDNIIRISKKNGVSGVEQKPL